MIFSELKIKPIVNDEEFRKFEEFINKIEFQLHLLDENEKNELLTLLKFMREYDEKYILPRNIQDFKFDKGKLEEIFSIFSENFEKNRVGDDKLIEEYFASTQECENIEIELPDYLIKKLEKIAKEEKIELNLLIPKILRKYVDKRVLNCNKFKVEK